MLKQEFLQAAGQHTANKEKTGELWLEIERLYTSPSRHYHNLKHLENLLLELTACRDIIDDWQTTIFSICYHDAVYDVMRQDNEEKSAEKAQECLEEIAVPFGTIQKCAAQIIATKSHTVSADNDTNLFTDADLSVLGKPHDTYILYCEQIREEYKIYPDALYKPGRKKVLEHFLQMGQIYKTQVFYNKYEKQARENMAREIESLI